MRKTSFLFLVFLASFVLICTIKHDFSLGSNFIVSAQILPSSVEDIHTYGMYHQPTEISEELLTPFATKNDLVIITQSREVIDKLRQENPDLLVLAYRQIWGSSHIASGEMLPWGEKPQTLRLTEWREANENEQMFFHSADPASLTLVPSDGRIKLFWSQDKRNAISDGKNDGEVTDLDLPIVGYNVYRRLPGGDFQQINSQAITATLYDDTNLTNGQTYIYKVYSLTRNAVGQETELFFSEAQNAQPGSATAQLYHQDLNIIFDPSNCGPLLETPESKDCFHPLPPASPDFEFQVRASGSPTKVILYFDYNKNWIYQNTSAGQEVYPMTAQNGTRLYQTRVDNAYTDDWAGFNYYFAAQYTDGNTQRLPETGFFTTNINNRIRARNWGGYLTDPHNSVWQNFSRQWVRNWISDFGYDGIFFDLGSNKGSFGYKAVDAPPLDQVINSDEFSFSFVQGKIELVRKVKEAITPGIVIYNGLYNDESLLSVSDGGMIEAFVCHGTLDLDPFCHSHEEWKGQVNSLIQADQNGKIVLLLPKGVIEDFGQEDTIKRRTYILTSYLLGKGTKSFTCTAQFGCFNRFPEYEIKIGNSVSFNSVNDYFVEQLGLYRRRYTNGLVFVNPFDEQGTKTVYFDRTRYQVLVKGGHSYPSTSPFIPDGYLAYKPTTLASLESKAGAIFLDNIPLGTGWNQLGIEIQLGAKTALADIDSDCGTETGLVVARKEQDFWQEYVAGYGGKNYDLQSNKNYSIKVSRACLWAPQ